MYGRRSSLVTPSPSLLRRFLGAGPCWRVSGRSLQRCLPGRTVAGGGASSRLRRQRWECVSARLRSRHIVSASRVVCSDRLHSRCSLQLIIANRCVAQLFPQKRPWSPREQRLRAKSRASLNVFGSFFSRWRLKSSQKTI